MTFPLSLRFAPCRAVTQFVLGVLAAGLCSGCGLEFGDSPGMSAAKNTCTQTNDCPGSTTCSRGLCLVTRTELPAFLLSITPPSGSGAISGLTFYQVADEVPRDIALTSPSQVRAAVYAEPLTADQSCVLDESILSVPPATDGSLPVRITLAPRTRLLNLSSPPIIQESALGDEEGSNSYALELVAPPGTYDVYVEPTTSDGGCVRPPVLFLDQYLPGGVQPLPIELPEPQVFEARIRYPKRLNDLGAWRLSIVERDTGRLLSNVAALGEPSETEEGIEYSARLAFSQLDQEVGDLAAEIVRLAPPKGAVGPTIYIERSIVDIFQDGQGVIDQLTHLPTPVILGARVVAEGSARGTMASINFIATQLLAIPAGTVGGFSTTVTTGEDGSFEVELLPGSYRALISPADLTLETTEIEVVVSDSASGQYGRLLHVAQRRSISGRLKNFGGGVMHGVAVTAQPVAPDGSSNVLALAQGTQPLIPGSLNDSTGEDGRFTVLADRGSFTVFARPQASSGYAWFVQREVEVGAMDVSLGDVRSDAPVVVNGTLTDSGGRAVPDTLIRAYAFLKDGKLVGRAPGEEADVNRPPTEAQRVIPVAETRVNQDGQYRLLLPSSFK